MSCAFISLNSEILQFMIYNYELPDRYCFNRNLNGGSFKNFEFGGFGFSYGHILYLKHDWCKIWSKAKRISKFQLSRNLHVFKRGGGN